MIYSKLGVLRKRNELDAFKYSGNSHAYIDNKSAQKAFFDQVRLWQLHDSLLNHKYLQLFQRWTRHKKNAHMEITFWNFSTTIYQGIGTFPWRYSQPLAHFAVLAALGTPPGARNRYCTCDWHGTSGGNAWMDEKPGSGPNIVPLHSWAFPTPILLEAPDLFISSK